MNKSNPSQLSHDLLHYPVFWIWLPISTIKPLKKQYKKTIQILLLAAYLIFEKLIRTHHSCKSKKTPVYSHLKSTMPEKPRFEVHLPITKSNWNFQVWLFRQERLWHSYRLRPGHITKSHALLDNLNSVIQFCQENGKATRSSRCCNWCHTSDTPSYNQDIVMHPTEFYCMSKKEHKAISNSRQKSSVNLDVTQHKVSWPL